MEQESAEIRRVYGCKVVVSDILERIATDERGERFGYCRLSYKADSHITPNDTAGTIPAQASPMQEVINNEADELEKWFESIQLPDHSVDITPYYTIFEPDRYVRGHCEQYGAENGIQGRTWSGCTVEGCTVKVTISNSIDI